MCEAVQRHRIIHAVRVLRWPPLIAILVATPALFLGTPVTASAQTDVAGFVKVVAGRANVLRGGQSQTLSPGDAVMQGDVLQTSAGGRLGITLRDDTRLSLGPNTQLTLTSFAFSPGEQRLGLVLRVARGIVEYVSGRIAKLAPNSIRLETPNSIVGVRGTHLLLGVGTP